MEVRHTILESMLASLIENGVDDSIRRMCGADWDLQVTSTPDSDFGQKPSLYWNFSESSIAGLQCAQEGHHS